MKYFIKNYTSDGIIKDFMVSALLLLLLAVASAAYTEEQLNCLYRLYDETGGENWHVKTHWPSPELRVFPHDPCTFAGITCSRKKDIEMIILSGNNLVGSLPGCLHVFDVTDMEFSTNQLHGEFPRVNCSRLDTLYYKFNEFTSLPENICDCHSLQYLHVEYNDMSGHVFPSCLLEKSEQFGILYAVNNNLYLDNGVRYTPASTNFIVGGNDLYLDFSTASLVKSPDTTMLDISATKSKGHISFPELFNKYPAAKELNLQGNFFTGDPFTTEALKPNHLLQVLDLDNNSFASVITSSTLLQYFNQYPAKMISFRVSNNHITGLPPTTRMLEIIRARLPNLQALDLGSNPFLCPPDYSMSQYSLGCTHILIEKISVAKDTGVRIITYLSTDTVFKHLPVDLIVSHLSASLMNMTAGVDADKWFLVPSIDVMTLVDANANKYKAIFSITEADAISLFGGNFQSITPDKVRILFDGKCVSVHENRKNAAAFNNHFNGVVSRELEERHLHASQGVDELKILVEFYGISKCPGYISTVSELINPFIRQYPELLQIVDIRFVSQADAEPRYSAHGITMHGQGEVFGDRFLMCLQEYVDYFIFNDVTSCLYADGTSSSIPYAIEDCLDQVISDKGLQKKIMDCKDGEMATSLFVESKKRCRWLGAAFSCTIFADSQLVCPYGDVTCPFDPYNIESFAVYLCNLYRAKNSYIHKMCKNILK
ncbi:Leucine-rich repeat protein [Giardia lamblia P15]|uniref:Leucine-rich repeat protein n=1 Tax=Giardia intestinalis (strain P15) TaxID=658858 RepID=E1EZE0_GIAIA|nr:Leucine-rich repeat protein [Giardia lamblia P15]